MSAFLCTEDHLGALCDAATAWDVKPPEGMGIHDAFAMLANENLVSLSARYNGSILKEWSARVKRYAYVRRPVLPVVNVLKLISSYEYQACEHDLWIVSDAYEWCDELRRAGISKLPGYDTASWAI